MNSTDLRSLLETVAAVVDHGQLLRYRLGRLRDTLELVPELEDSESLRAELLQVLANARALHSRSADVVTALALAMEQPLPVPCSTRRS